MNIICKSLVRYRRSSPAYDYYNYGPEVSPPFAYYNPGASSEPAFELVSYTYRKVFTISYHQDNCTVEVFYSLIP